MQNIKARVQRSILTAGYFESNLVPYGAPSY